MPTWRFSSVGLEAGLVPCTIRLEPKFYNRSKSAGYTFLGEQSVKMLKELIQDGSVKPTADSPLLNVIYITIYSAIRLARKKAGIGPKIQPDHGFRKYFEACLDPFQEKVWRELSLADYEKISKAVRVYWFSRLQVQRLRNFPQ